MRLGWLTDPHFNFQNLNHWDEFVAGLVAARLSGLVITGDISEADDFDWHLIRLKQALHVPVYFVLGNHDFYHGQIDGVRSKAAQISDQFLCYLQANGPQFIADGWALCGVDGWADGRFGDYYRSPVRMNDFQLIKDLKGLSSECRLRKLRREGALAAVILKHQLKIATESAQHVVIATHIPPFRESCWYDGGHSDDDWAPFFCCGALGWMIRRFATSHPTHKFIVICGHTHHSGRSKIMENVWTWTGASDYGAPQLADIIQESQSPFDAEIDFCFASE